MCANIYFRILLLLLVLSGERTASGDAVELAVRSDEQEQKSVVCLALRENASELAGKVVDANVVTSVGNAIGSGRRCRFVSSMDAGFADRYLDSGERVKTTFRDSTNKWYTHDRSGRVMQVDIDCANPSCPFGFDVLSKSLVSSCWLERNVEANVDGFCADLLSTDHASQDSWHGERVITLKSVSEHDNDRRFETRYYFGDRFDRLVLLAIENYGQAQSLARDSMIVDRSIWELDYKLIDDRYVLPSAWSLSATTEKLSHAGHALGEPVLLKSQNWIVSSYKLSEDFPNDVFEIRVPPTARIKNHCEEEQQRSHAKNVERRALEKLSRNYFLWLGGLSVVLGGAVWYFRKRKQ